MYVSQHTHHPIPPPTGSQAQTGRWVSGALLHTNVTSRRLRVKESAKKRLHTYKTVEHGAGHPSCEAHVEERRGCVWMTRSLWSSSTSSAWGAGVTILLLAGASPPLVHCNPFCLLPVHSTFCTFPLFKRCFKITPWFWHPLRKTHTPPSRRAREQPCLKRAPIIMLRGGIVRMRAAALAISGFTAKKKAKVMEWHLPG